MAKSDTLLYGFTKGERVQIHPATDTWMCGDRYGTIVKIGERNDIAQVLMDRSNRLLKFNQRNLMHID